MQRGRWWPSQAQVCGTRGSPKVAFQALGRESSLRCRWLCSRSADLGWPPGTRGHPLYRETNDLEKEEVPRVRLTVRPQGCGLEWVARL